MAVKMKVVSYDANEHSLVVRYFTDKLSEDDLAVKDGYGNIKRREDGSPFSCRTDYNVTINEVPLPTGSQLTDRLLKLCPPPYEFLELHEKIKDPKVDTSMTAAEPIAGVVLDAPERPAIETISVPPGYVPPVQLRARREKNRQIGTSIL